MTRILRDTRKHIIFFADLAKKIGMILIHSCYVGIVVLAVVFIYFLKRFYLFIFREGKGGRKREGEKHQCVVASRAPRHVP